MSLFMPLALFLGNFRCPLFQATAAQKNFIHTHGSVYTIGNLLTVFMADYLTMNMTRFISGIPYGTFFGVGLVAIKQISNPQYIGRNAAFMVSGLTIANLVGIPIATYLNNCISWRTIYLFIGLLGFFSLYTIVKWLPALEPMPYTNFKGQFQFLKKLPSGSYLALSLWATAVSFANLAISILCLFMSADLVQRKYRCSCFCPGLACSSEIIFPAR